MEGSSEGDWGKLGKDRGPGWLEAKGDEVAKKPVRAPRQKRRGDLPGWSRGMQVMGGGGNALPRGEASGGLRAQISDLGGPPERARPAASAARVGQARLQRPLPGAQLR